jgi:hypothetical protein
MAGEYVTAYAAAVIALLKVILPVAALIDLVIYAVIGLLIVRQRRADRIHAGDD